MSNNVYYRIVLMAAVVVWPTIITSEQASANTKSGYSIRVSNSGAGGNPGFFYVGGPLNITVKNSRKRTDSSEVTITITPNAIDRKGPFTTKVGKTLTGLAPSQAGLTTIRVKVDTTVLLRKIRVRKVA